MRRGIGVGCRVSGVGCRVSGFTFYVLRITHYALRTTHYAVLAAVLLLLLSLGLWSLFSPRDDGSLAEIRRRGTLRVGLDASFPPFETIDANGQIVGLDVDIAQAIAADLGVEVELVNIGFDGLYDALLARRVDLVISGLPYDPRWTQDVAYSSNYFNAGQVLVVRAGDDQIKTVEDLTGRTVAVEWGSQAEMEARRLVQNPPSPSGRGAGGEGEISKTSEISASITLLRQETATAALDAVTNNQADAAIVDAPSALSALTPSPSEGEGWGGGLKVVTYLTDEWYAAAVHIQSRELLAAVNQTLERLEESGEMVKLQAKWFQHE
ncbi:MAG: transporter substrate-binding domain-containing protein [Chloroflexi bacterium]|nr:transporter substrate-binding domain-containing protein [Chloroflexota bacterium]